MIFWSWVLILAVLLFFPVSKLIYVLSVRRQQRKLNRELDGAALAAQKRRARLIAVVVCSFFSFLFNYSTIGFPVHG